MKIIVCYFAQKRITLEKASIYAEDIARFIYEVDGFYFYNTSQHSQSVFLEYLRRFENAEYAYIPSFSEIDRYNLAMTKAESTGADYVVVLEPGHYYEEGSFTALKRTLLQWDEGPLPSVLSPIPLLTNEEFRQEDFIKRPILGCRLLGTLINVKCFCESNGFNNDYYQSTFDYEYCIEQRLKGNKIYLLNNSLFRTREYIMHEKRKMFFFKYFLYHKTIEELYYETRNRHYLWQKYRKLDPEYVKLDKKLYRHEIRMLRKVDPDYREKRYIIKEAIDDFKENMVGKKFNEIEY